MRCVVKLSLSAFAVVKTRSCPGKLIHSIIPRVKSSLNFQRFCSLKKKSRHSVRPTDEESNRTFLASCLQSQLSSLLFSFYNQREHRSDKKRRRQMQRQRTCGGKQAGRCNLFTCSDQVHLENNRNSKDCQPRQKYVSAILGTDAHKDNTVMLAG